MAKIVRWKDWRVYSLKSNNILNILLAASTTAVFRQRITLFISPNLIVDFNSIIPIGLKYTFYFKDTQQGDDILKTSNVGIIGLNLCIIF